MQNPTRLLFAALALSTSLAFLACDPVDPGSDPDKLPVDTLPGPVWTPGGPFTLRGPWAEKRQEDIIYFAGRFLSLDFEADSVTLYDYQFTDAVDCRVDAQGKQLGCADYEWTNIYRGTWTLNDRALHIDFHFVHTTAGPWTENVPLGPTTADFEAGPAEDRNDILVLTRTSPGEFIVRDTHFVLHRPKISQPRYPLEGARRSLEGALTF